MRIFLPELRLATTLGPQLGPQDKLGGLPWGLPADRWPRCASCDSPLALLAQWFHHPERLDLGRPGRCLFVFQCNGDPGMCETWDAEGGANACFVLEPESLTGAPTPSPEPDLDLETEARVAGWREEDDGIPEEMEAAFYDDTAELPETMLRRSRPGTRLGGVPRWRGGAEEGPGPGWSFVGQIDSTLRFRSRPPTPDEVGCPVGRRGPAGYETTSPTIVRPGAPAVVLVEQEAGDHSLWTADGPAFGDGGTGYVFLSDPSGGRKDAPPRGRFFWQSR